MSLPDSHPLKSLLLSLSVERVGAQPTDELPHVWSVVLEWNLDGTTVTLLSLVDGTTSLYWGEGGGIIGAGEHETVRQAARAWIGAAEECVETIPVGGSRDAGPGEFRVTIKAYDGDHSLSDASPDAGSYRTSHILFQQAQDVMTAVREVTG
ncbi:MAG: hypothetical protein JSS66_10225 [Armatimonadetes bacterium]|nr:hypothetical protein [Armatimonadota bacterium]